MVKINANVQRITEHQRKGNQARMQKKTSSLIFFFVVKISVPKVILKVENSRTSRKRLPKMQRLSGRLRLTEGTARRASSEERSGRIYFREVH